MCFPIYIDKPRKLAKLYPAFLRDGYWYAPVRIARVTGFYFLRATWAARHAMEAEKIIYNEDWDIQLPPAEGMGVASTWVIDSMQLYWRFRFPDLAHEIAFVDRHFDRVNRRRR